VNLAEQIPRGTVAAHAVLLRIGPAHAAPHVAIHIAAHSVGNPRGKTVGEDFTVGQLAGVDIDVENADVRRAAISEAGVDDVQPLFVWRENDAVRLCEVISYRLDLTCLAVDAEDVMFILFLGLLEAFVVAPMP
jgi:hypothetical protein